MYKNKIIKIIEDVTGEKDVHLEVPVNSEFGDYSSNIALQSKRQEVKGESPREIAEEIVSKINKEPGLPFEASAKDGFINFYLKKDVLVDNLTQIDTYFGKSDLGKGKTAIVEYSSPNIAKPFTVGHLRSTIIGDAIANLLEITGWKVLRDNHLGDWGTQFGKQIYAIKAWGNKKKGEEYTVKELVSLYVKFHKEVEKNPEIEEKAREWFKKLEDGDNEARELWQKCVDWSWIEFEKIYSLLGVGFSPEFNGGRGLGESFFESRMASVISELKQKKMLKVGEKGAQLVFFKDDKYPPAMILKKDGATLYHTRDLATDKYRLEKYNPDLIINEVGVEQTLYFRQLFEMENMLGWYKEGQRVHVGHGLIRFKDGKMSTRKGNVIWMEELLEEAKKRAFNLGSSRQHITWGKDYVETKSKKSGVETRKFSEIINISDKVAIGALKYNDLKRDSKTEIVFDWDEILNMEGNSGPYLQYTVARTNSVLSKAKNLSNKNSLKINNLELKIEEQNVLRTLVHFPEVVEESAQNYSPNLLCNYLYNLASKFNTFYNAHKIIDGENEEFKLVLTQKTGIVLKTGLSLLGIQTPEKM